MMQKLLILLVSQLRRSLPGLLLLLAAGPVLAQSPANDNCATAIPVTVSAGCAMPVNGSVQSATQSLAPVPSCGFNVLTANDVWYSFTATGTNQLLTLAPRFAAILDVRSGTCAASASVFCAAIFNGNTAVTNVTGLTSGQTYFVRVYASGTMPPAGISSTFALCISPGLVVMPPANDDCAGAIDVPVQAGGVCSTQTLGDNTSATPTVGLADPTCANYRGADIWFKVTVPASGGLTVQTVTPNQTSLVTNTGMAVYSGTCSSLALIGCDDNSGGNLKSLLNISGRTPGEVLYIRVWSFGGTTTGPIALCAVTFSIPANDDCAGAIAVPVTTGCTAPVSGSVYLATQSLAPTPACGNATAANDVWYSFVATGATQSVIFNGGFQSVLDVRSGTCANSTSVFCSSGFGSNPRTISGLTSGQTYFLRVYPTFGTPTSTNAAFTLCINPGLTIPANDECAGAVPLPSTATCTAPVAGTVTLATQSLPPTTGCGNAATANDVWYSFTAAGTTQNLLFVGQFGAVVDVRSGTCASSTSVFCSTAFSNQLLTATGLVSGQTYFLRLFPNGNFTPNNGAFTICLSGGSIPPANDECVNAVALPVSTGITCTAPTSGTIQAASQSIPPSTGCGTATAANDVWYSFTATGATQNITFTGGFQAVVDVRSGTCANSTSVFCSTVFNNQPVTAAGLTSGQTYFLRVYNNSTFVPTNATFTLCLTPGTVPPANDDCAAAIALPVAFSCATPVSGTYAGATQSLPPTTGCGNTTTVRDVWYAFIANGPTQTLAVASQFQTVAEVRTGTCATSTSVFCGTTFGAQPLILLGLTTGQAYFLRLYPQTNNNPTATNGVFTVCLMAGPPPSPNDECATAVAVAVAQTCVTSTNGSVSNATQSLPPSGSCGTALTAADVWYSFVAGATSQLITLTPRFGAVLDVRSGTCATSTSVFCNVVPAIAATGNVVGGLTVGSTYYIRIYANGNTQPTTANATFTLCITPAPTPPANDECAGAIPVPVTATCTTVVTGTVEGASQSLAPTAGCSTAIIAADVWFSFVASGPTQLLTLTPRTQLVVDMRSGTCAASTSLLCATVQPNAAGGIVLGGLTAGSTYFLRIFANGNSQPTPLNAAFTLCLNPGPTPPANDECVAAIAVPVTPTCTPTSGSVAAASQSVSPTTGCGFGVGLAADVWYSFVATGISHSITLAPQFQGVLDVRSGPCTASTSIFCATAFTGSATAQLVGGLVIGQTYFIRVYAASATQPTGAAAAFTVCVAPAPTPPANDECANATNVPVQFGSCLTQSVGSNIAATASAGAPAPTCNAAYRGGDIWFKVTVPPSGALTIRTVLAPVSDVGDTGMTVYSGACGSLTEIGCDDDSGGSFKSLVNLSGRTAGEVLYIRVWSFNNNITGNIAVCVTSPTTCTAPTAPAATTSPALPTEANISWTPGGTIAPGTTYTVEYGPQGFALGTGTMVSGISSPNGQLTGLQPATAYCFYVRTDCPGTTGSSAYVGPTCFTTPTVPLVCPDPSGLTSTVGNASVMVGWTAGTPAVAGATYTVVYGPSGFNPFTSGTNVVGLTATNTVLSGFAPGTVYCFYVQQICPGTNNRSALVGPTCFTLLGTRAATESAAVRVYPNPGHTATGKVAVQFAGLRTSGHATLLNSIGQTVRTLDVPAGSSEQPLPVSGLAAGIYTLRVVVGPAVLTRKVVLD